MITYLIIGITIVVSFSCFGRQGLMSRLSFNSYAIIRRGEWYRVITHGFVHADTMHLFINMFTFWSFGTLMEATFGRWEFTALYFGGMIFSSAYDFVKYRNNVYYQSIGASGAVSAVLFSSILLNPWGTILLFAVIPIPGILFGILYLAYCRYMARQASDHINHNAHFYGALYGLVFPVLLHPSLIPLFLSRLTDLPWLK